MKLKLFLLFVISTLAYTQEYIGIGKNETYGYEMEIKVKKDNQNRIENITILRDNTRQGISRRALPKLIEQAIEKNSSDIDSVAGATYTSEIFIDALKNIKKI